VSTERGDDEGGDFCGWIGHAAFSSRRARG
jgi:hypothetical protein